jgi:hypothetical protein
MVRCEGDGADSKQHKDEHGWGLGAKDMSKYGRRHEMVFEALAMIQFRREFGKFLNPLSNQAGKHGFPVLWW